MRIIEESRRVAVSIELKVYLSKWLLVKIDEIIKSGRFGGYVGSTLKILLLA